jgi:cytochrome bd ubiquinol oxidase subunit II
MIAIWYAIVCFMVLMFIVLEGFDIGAGMLQCIVAKTEDERRLVITAIGPLWSWHEVWLVGFGGTFLLAFPAVMALTFSGFYLAFMLLLWCLIFRGVAMEFSGHIADPLWRTAWNFCFVVSNALLAILVGTAIGNVIRGVPLGADEKIALPLFTNFSPYGNVGILDWYTVSLAVFTLAIFAAHGANGLAQRTDGAVHDRSLAISPVLWKTVLVGLAIIAMETLLVRPSLFSGIVHQPFGWMGLIGIVAGTVGVFRCLRRNDASRALISSTVLIAGLMISTAVGAFPVLLRSTLAPEYSLSAYHTAAGSHGLAVALIWWPIALLFAVGYFLFIFPYYYKGKVALATDSQTPY